jgi:rhamnosyltransferase
MKNNSIAAGVVLFIPGTNTVSNILTYAGQVAELFVFDNSPTESREVVQELRTKIPLTYLEAGKNLGIGAALNHLANAAGGKGYRFLLTMDQDSWFGGQDLNELISVAEESDQIGIVSPYHQAGDDVLQNQPGEREEMVTTMTSGNLLNLAVYRSIGGFDEKLFIDSVDLDFCLRLRLNGYKIIWMKSVVLEHRVGNASPRTFFGWTVHPTNHSAIRWFYQTRNWFYVIHRYGAQFPDFFRVQKKRFWKSVLKMVFFENDRTRKLIMMCRGYLAWRHNDFTNQPVLSRKIST